MATIKKKNKNPELQDVNMTEINGIDLSSISNMTDDQILNKLTAGERRVISALMTHSAMKKGSKTVTEGPGIDKKFFKFLVIAGFWSIPVFGAAVPTVFDLFVLGTLYARGSEKDQEILLNVRDAYQLNKPLKLDSGLDLRKFIQPSKTKKDRVIFNGSKFVGHVLNKSCVKPFVDGAKYIKKTKNTFRFKRNVAERPAQAVQTALKSPKLG